MLQRARITLTDLRPTTVPLRDSFLYRLASDLKRLPLDSTIVFSQSIAGSLEEAESKKVLKVFQ